MFFLGTFGMFPPAYIWLRDKNYGKIWSILTIVVFLLTSVYWWYQNLQEIQDLYQAAYRWFIIPSPRLENGLPRPTPVPQIPPVSKPPPRLKTPHTQISPAPALPKMFVPPMNSPPNDPAIKPPPSSWAAPLRPSTPQNCPVIDGRTYCE